MADKRISQLIERTDIANNDVLPIVASGATTTNKVTISTIQEWMQDNLDVGVTSVGITIGSTGTDINVTGSPITTSGNITINIPTASATNRGLLSSSDWTSFNNKLSSVGLTMPSAFTVSNSPLTANGTIAVTGAGTVAQYIRGDGSLADFPEAGGGGASVSYYLNGSVSQGTIGGIAYLEMNKTPILGAGTDFTINANGYIASFITDAGDPNLLEIPAGNWNFETYLSASSGGGTPTFYIELYKVNSGGTATLIASNSTTPESISLGTNINPYFSALAVPQTTLLVTDRLALRYYVTPAGRTITLHTENSHLCQIITTFTTGLTALNGLTAQVQNFATGTSGTNFGISSTGSTHTFNLPDASATARGVVTTGSQTFAGTKTFNSDLIVNGITVGKGNASNGNNTAIGANALASNTTGTLNTATGISSLSFNTAGNGNTANGALSLVGNTTGGFNTAIGSQSLYSNTTGGANTAIGLDSLYSNTTGTYNVGVGSSAGYYIANGTTPNTTSDFSIYLGADTKASIDGAQNEVVIGYNAIGNGSNTVTIGNSSVTDNYFTGTVRSTALRLAANGGADAVVFRNVSGTTGSDSGATTIGFNGSDNIFVNTQSRGGFVLGFNNSVSNRQYDLPDASGTLALTSNLSGYLPLSGGTLTGALNGTSASFTGAVNGQQGIFRNSGVPAIQVIRDLNVVSVGSAGQGIEFGALNGTTPTAGAAIYGALDNPATTGNLVFQTLNAGTLGTRLTIANTGAATFSSSVQAGGLISSNGSYFRLANSAGSVPYGYFITTSQWTGAGTDNTPTIATEAGYGFRIYTNSATTPTLSLASTGAANFSSSGIANATTKFAVNGAGLISSFGSTGSGTDNYIRFVGNTNNFDVGINGTSWGVADAGVAYRFLITQSGNVGIGTPSPNSKLEVVDGTGCVFRAIGNGTNVMEIGNYKPTTSGGAGYQQLDIAGSILAFYTGTAGGGSAPERMRITSGGFLKASNTGTYFSSTGTYHELRSNNASNAVGVIQHNGTDPYGIYLNFNTSPNNTTNYFIQGDDSVNTKFFIYSNGNMVNRNGSYGAISDIKLKENIEDATPKLDDLMKVKVRNYNLIGDDKKQIGVIAQELEEVFPAMIDESEDFEEVEVSQLDEEGNEILNEEGEVQTTKERVSKGTTTKSVKYSVFVPMLIKAMQEQQEQIKELRAEIEALKLK
jgi:hypothetical protein